MSRYQRSYASPSVSLLVCACVFVFVGGRPQRSGRQSDSRLTVSWCNYNRKHSRRLSTSQSHQILCAYRTLHCWLCRICNPGPTTRPRSAVWPPVIEGWARLHQMISFHRERADICFGWDPQHYALIIVGPHLDFAALWTKNLMHGPDWYCNIFKVFLLIYVFPGPAESPQWNRQTSVIYLPTKTQCFRNNIFSYLMSICVLSVYVGHTNNCKNNSALALAPLN